MKGRFRPGIGPLSLPSPAPTPAPKPYNRRQMQLASSPAFPEPLLAALPQLSEKLRQGFASKNRAWHPGKIASKFMVSLGLLAVLVLNLCPTPLLGQETVYNFTVDKNHDYFVGETGFLVHNAGGCGPCRSGRGKNKLSFDPDAFGPHSTFRRGLDGVINHWQDWIPNPQNPNGFDPGNRYDGVGGSHENPVTGIDMPTPHVHDPEAPGGIRLPLPCEIPE